MLKHYLKQISECEFSERNLEISKLVSKQKSAMNARGVMNSTITLKAVADFFAAEFIARCDFLKKILFVLTRTCSPKVTALMPLQKLKIYFRVLHLQKETK